MTVSVGLKCNGSLVVTDQTRDAYLDDDMMGFRTC